ncbi:unnamed protein product [marine sediment metagenome]|uniref:Uncharacterized protein n=1 Tax=marine sediment metagenome TaxID=412755 RepID=X1ALK7_9ZZZZ
MKFLIPKIMQLDISPTFIYLGIGKNFGFNFNGTSYLAIAIKGITLAVWKFYTGDKWTRLCFALGPYKFAIRIL